jgi:hypothetical protein
VHVAHRPQDPWPAIKRLIYAKQFANGQPPARAPNALLSCARANAKQPPSSRTHISASQLKYTPRRTTVAGAPGAPISRLRRLKIFGNRVAAFDQRSICRTFAIRAKRGFGAMKNQQKPVPECRMTVSLSGFRLCTGQASILPAHTRGFCTTNVLNADDTRRKGAVTRQDVLLS